ncbi:MBL fold metallo-hydrolase [Myxosarcina sp. GI1]|uniref:MBL fold metallo-hydrolase n=1 Tax=Myxosarcina sp. GI1 TaxID=1541065 RepID=UPI00056A5DCF|nr:MBL fold metallo-hydrolase [Myxosarcina sp. GI1]
MNHNQSICKVCGYNMIGDIPDVCPFCGANHNEFISWNEAQQIYRVTPYRVNDYVTQLRLVPRLGLEHAAYCIETDDAAVWIDCPSVFDPDLKPVEAIYFTHKDFIGASNQYREAWDTKVYLHALDAKHPLVRQFPVDRKFKGDFSEHGIEAFHIGGHTPGFTLYIYDKVLFICDYAFPPGSKMRFNPFGPQDETRKRAARILEIIDERSLLTVCGYNYVTEFDSWLENFQHLVEENSRTVA